MTSNGGTTMDERQLYADTKDSIRSVRPSYFFTLNCVLYSRLDPATPDTPTAYDRDVDAYLAQLAQACAAPDDAAELGAPLSKYDADVFRRLQSCADGRLKYLVYRTRDDFLLVSVGIFEQSPDPRQKKFPPSEDASIGRGRDYYQFTYTYSQQLRHTDTAVSEVLEKLSVGFEKYSRILSHLRGEYFDLAAHLAAGEFYHLELTTSEEVRQLQLREREDRFLETYAEWRRTGDEELKAALQRQAEEIRRLKPDFKFTA